VVQQSFKYRSTIV